MGNLRDQFKKANLLSDKEARRLAHEARIERTAKGREGLEQEQGERQQELTGLQRQQREQTRLQQQAVEEQRQAQAEAAAVAAILAEARKAGPGPGRWYFQTPEGELPWLEVSPQDVRELRASMLAIVRTGPGHSHDYRLLPLALARRVQRVRPEAVVFAPRGAG